jgi:heme-degrading monooxygenase HmoA
VHARMTTIQTQPGKVAEAMDIARGSMTPHASDQQGFKGLLALTDPESDEVVFISLWDSEDDLQAGEDSGYYEEQIGKLSNILAGRTEREVFEAVILAQVTADNFGGRT